MYICVASQHCRYLKDNFYWIINAKRIATTLYWILLTLKQLILSEIRYLALSLLFQTKAASLLGFDAIQIKRYMTDLQLPGLLEAPDDVLVSILSEDDDADCYDDRWPMTMIPQVRRLVCHSDIIITCTSETDEAEYLIINEFGCITVSILYIFLSCNYSQLYFNRC